MIREWPVRAVTFAKGEKMSRFKSILANENRLKLNAQSLILRKAAGKSEKEQDI